MPASRTIIPSLAIMVGFIFASLTTVDARITTGASESGDAGRS
jgi:hypothetical protein